MALQSLLILKKKKTFLAKIDDFLNKNILNRTKLWVKEKYESKNIH